MDLGELRDVRGQLGGRFVATTILYLIGIEARPEAGAEDGALIEDHGRVDHHEQPSDVVRLPNTACLSARLHTRQRDAQGVVAVALTDTVDGAV
jgi:hypothetical protein